jgi:uncharacterized OB-fold protein
MSEFTGTYNQCDKCGHIYDFNDICPECGSDDIMDIEVHEIKEIISEYQNNLKRLLEMLQKHDD